MCCGAGEEGRGLAFYPGDVAGAVEGGEGMAALAAGHLENSLVLVAGGNDEALGLAEAWTWLRRPRELSENPAR